MKKIVLFTAILSLSLFLTGCATTKGAEQKPAPEDTQSKTETPAQDSTVEQSAPTEQQPTAEQQSPAEESASNAPTESEQDNAVEDEPVVLEPVAPEDASFASEPEPEPVEEEEAFPALPNDEDIPILIAETPEPENTTAPKSEEQVATASTPEEQPAAEPTTTTTDTAPVVETVPTTTTPATTVPSTTAKPATAQSTKPSSQQTTTTATKPTSSTTAPRTNAGEVETIEIPADEPEPTVSSETSSVVAKNDGVPSRSVTVLTNQYLDVIYPGTGWVYLGEANGATLMKYFGRKIGTTDTSFSLRSSKAGDTVLHFYKNDILTGEYIDDYLAVTVQDKRSTTTAHVTAPSYAEYVPPRLASSSARNNSSANSSDDSSVNNADAGSSSTTAKSSTGTTSKAASTTTKSGTSSKNNASTSSGSLDDSNVQTVIQTTESSPTTAGSSSQNTSSSRSVGNSSTATTTTANSSSSGAKTNSSAQQSSASTADIFGANAAGTNTATEATTSSLQDTTNLSSDDILSLAQKAFDSKKYRDTLTYLDAFFDKAVTRVDEGLYLQGRTLESNSEVRNIKSALDTYESLVKNYPQSIDWERANERITYLKRFYFNIR